LDTIIETSRFDFSGENNAQIFYELSTKIESFSLSKKTKTAAFETMRLSRIKTGDQLKSTLFEKKKPLNLRKLLPSFQED